MGSTKAAMKAGQDTKEAYNRTLEKQELTKMKPALGWFFFGHTSTNVTAGQAVLQSLCFKEKT
jgi:hypothetical protein